MTKVLALLLAVAAIGCGQGTDEEDGIDPTSDGKADQTVVRCEGWQDRLEGKCVVKPESLWAVEAVSVNVKKKDGWGFGDGAPDPKLYMGWVLNGRSYFGSTYWLDDRTEAVWNEVVAAALPASLLMTAHWSITVFDHDPLLPGDDIIDSISGPFPASVFAQESNTITKELGQSTVILKLTAVAK